MGPGAIVFQRFWSFFLLTLASREVVVWFHYILICYTNLLLPTCLTYGPKKDTRRGRLRGLKGPCHPSMSIMQHNATELP
ncbi:hypothetical protein GE21DRAFT_1129601 [Neurospora crassa]|nr:hypothetical protein GE21DRAFT_1129601 [Neurospora crassa]